MATALLNRAANDVLFSKERESCVGVFGGECFRATCKATGATWFHTPHRRYYCGACAAEINREHALRGEPSVCVRRI